ncbi:hypothetical protein [Bradyrhizobium sp. JR3.5]
MNEIGPNPSRNVIFPTFVCPTIRTQSQNISSTGISNISNETRLFDLQAQKEVGYFPDMPMFFNIRIENSRIVSKRPLEFSAFLQSLRPTFIETGETIGMFLHKAYDKIVGIS